MTKENFIIENDNWDDSNDMNQRQTVKLSNSDLP